MPPIDNWWDSINLDGITDADIESYFKDYGISSPSDPKVVADVTAALQKAKQTGQTGFENVLNKILLYGDKALQTLSKAGIIKNQNLVNAGYGGFDSSTDTTTTNKAPDPTNRVFSIDFTNPTTLIIAFVAVLLLFYFLFFKPKKSKNAKR
ncbi:hypothetical protein [Spirosoma linguale]|uniref:Uncharacterized protein n=1 Tax=Spirosoma linguale (strain ATCC 33905 / DSM 74 / LMG 10896 / Claus 1) TaxID=504472 RepID=D2QGY6_SPILD|nr:hypothetical protein Slin_0689 [Spirosoma linguale DSM 74]